MDSELYREGIPLTRLLEDYGRLDVYPLHMPGHKRRSCGGMPEEIFRMDITEIDGFDNLHQAQGLLKGLQEHAAEMYGAEETFYLINGSTCGILSAVSAAVPEGGHILIARNCHKSVYHACYLRNLTVSYLYPEKIEEFGICEAVTCRQVEDALDRERHVDAVLIVSPTYEGRIADVAAIARSAHRRGIPLIVDEAHGAHLGFAEGFARNSCQCGADLVIHSVHKTLPAPTQTALLHVSGNLIDREKLRRFLRIYQSSSPSYLLMAGIDNALRQVDDGGKEMFGRFLERYRRMCHALSSMQCLRILNPEERQDVGKLVVSTRGTRLTGVQLQDMLLNGYRLQSEMTAGDYVLAMFTVGDSEEGFLRTKEALLEIDGQLKQERGEAPGLCAEERLRPRTGNRGKERAIPLKKAWDAKTRWCELSECPGKYAGGFIGLYPPGTPMDEPGAVPGEEITDLLAERIGEYVRAGLTVEGVRCAEGKIFLPVLAESEN